MKPGEVADAESATLKAVRKTIRRLDARLLMRQQIPGSPDTMATGHNAICSARSPYSLRPTARIVLEPAAADMRRACEVLADELEPLA